MALTILIPVICKQLYFSFDAYYYKYEINYENYCTSDRRWYAQ